MSNKTLRRPSGWLIVPLLLGMFTATVNAAETAPAAPETIAQHDVFEALPKLDSDYQSLLNQYLNLRTQQADLQTVSNSAALSSAVQRAPNAVAGSALIRKNLPRVLRQSSSADLQQLLAYIYNANDTATVKALTEHINQADDVAAASQNYFLLAQYYYSRSNWQGVRAALSKVEIQDLSTGDGHYYDLLMGYALQALKDHRKAVRFYKNIPATSPYYPYAKLNQGTAFLRQGWWSEAHMELEEAIANANKFGDQELHDRLLVVMAYSQLNYEFYRDARKTLRRVSIDGAYTNKALMGLGLAAAYQEDFAGAVNAFNLLTQQTPADLSVDEGHLLLTYAAVEIGDTARAELAYQNAIGHYQNKIDTLDQLLAELEASSVDAVSALVAQLDDRAAEIYASERLIPAYFLENYQGLAAMQRNRLNAEVQKSVVQLQRQYQSQLKKMVSTNIMLRKTMLESYLSQAKYGKAKLYDN